MYLYQLSQLWTKGICLLNAMCKFTVELGNINGFGLTRRGSRGGRGGRTDSNKTLQFVDTLFNDCVRIVIHSDISSDILKFIEYEKPQQQNPHLLPLPSTPSPIQLSNSKELNVTSLPASPNPVSPTLT